MGTHYIHFAITNGESVFGRLIPEKSLGLLNQLLACGSAFDAISRL